MITRPLKAPTDPVYDFTTLQHHLDRGGLYASDKEDGIRCLIHPIHGPVSQKMLPIPNNWVHEILRVHCPPFLDGELVALDCEGNDCTFNDTQSTIMTRDGQPRFVFRIFDWFGDTLMSYQGRYMKTRMLVKEATNDCIQLLQQTLCTKVAHIENEEESALERGKEGLMLRHPKGIYKQGRSTLSEAYLLKVKRFKDDEARVIGIEEEMENCNPATRDAHGLAKRSKHRAGMAGKQRVGKLICDWNKHMIKVASGMTDAQKMDWWDAPWKIVGKSITFRYQAHGMKDLPRCPVFHGIRHD